VRSVGVREFRDQATAMMSAGETIVIERHGKPIGFFVPISAKDRRAGRDALGRLASELDELHATTGVDENELVRELGRTRRR